MRHRAEQLNMRTILLIAVFFMMGCSVNPLEYETELEQDINQVDENDQISDKDTIRIGFSMDTLIEERWEKDKDMFKEAAETLGAEVIVKAANGDDALQIAQAETLISQGIDLLVLVPHNAEAAASIVGKAQMAEIPVISYDRLVMNANVDLYVSFDNEEIGALQAKAMTELVPEGKYVYIAGAETDNNAHLMKKGLYKVLLPYIHDGRIEIVYDQWTDAWMPVNAKENMLAALEANDNQIDAVIAANDATAGGVIEALEEAGLAGQIPVIGQDAELEGVQRIVKGTQTMTVYKSIQSLTERAAQIAVDMATHKEVVTRATLNNGKKDVPAILLTPVIVDQKNIDTTIIADEYHTEEEVYEFE